MERYVVLNTHNRPKPGASIRVDPIRGLDNIQKIRELLAEKPRDLCLFNFGVNTGCRAGELLSLNVGDVWDLKPHEPLHIKQSKTQKYRTIYPNALCIESLEAWLSQHPDCSASAPLFRSTRPRRKTYAYEDLLVSSVTRLVKGWCHSIGLTGNFGSHTLRKAFGYTQRTNYNVGLEKLMVTFGHSSEMQTLRYIGLMPSEIQEIYANHV